MLIAKPPGEWLDATGRFDPDYPHAGATGALTVAVLVWPGSAREGLAKFRSNDASGFAAREIARLDARVPLAAGWRLWRLGETQIFRAEVGDSHRASEQWSRGERCLAHIHLAFAGLPQIGEDGATRLALADEALAKGVAERNSCYTRRFDNYES
jgi:hypothetical protein